MERYSPEPSFLMPNSDIRDLRLLEQEIRSSYCSADFASSNWELYSGYFARTMDGVESPCLLGSRCHSSSLRKGMKGWIRVSPPSSAAYSVSIVLALASALPSWMIALEFSCFGKNHVVEGRACCK